MLEEVVKRSGIIVFFQWPKESLDFVKIVREKIKKKAYFSKLRQTYVEEIVQILGHVRKKEIGKFVPLAYWRIPPMDKTKWYWHSWASLKQNLTASNVNR